MRKPKVILIAPSIRRTPGGMSFVISSLLRDPHLNKKFKLSHIESHVEGFKIEKVIVLVKAVVIFLLKIWNAHIVHIHSAEGASFFRKSIFSVISKILGKKSVFHIHGATFDEFYEKLSRGRKKYMRYVLNRVHTIVVIAEYWKEKLMQMTDNEKICVLYNWTDREICTNSTDKRDIQILFLGRLCRRKGVYDLIKCIPEVLCHFPGVKFILAGDGEIEEVRNLVNKMGLENVVKITGWVEGEAKLDLLCQSSIFILPSYHEGLPVSIIEALSAGLPVISTPVGGIPEMVFDGVNGYIVKPGDYKTLSQKIVNLLKDEKELKHMASHSLRIWKEKFKRETVIKKLITLYEA